MAAGGIIPVAGFDARQRRRSKKRRAGLAKENQSDALFSEHAVYAAQSRWEKHDIVPDTKIPTEAIGRICAQFERFADEWSSLPVGGSVTLFWVHPPCSRSGRR